MSPLAEFIISYPYYFSIFRFPAFLRESLRRPMLRIHQYALHAVERAPPQGIKRLQEQRAQHLIRYAFERVPFWRERITNSPLRSPDAFRTIADLQKLPVVTKAELKRVPLERLLAEGVRAERLMRDSTSGSTGEPFHFYLDLWTAERKTALLLRGAWWCGGKFSDRLVRIRNRDLLMLTTGDVLFINSYNDLDRVIDILQSKSMEKFILHAPVSTLIMLARRIVERNTTIRPRVLLASAEKCSDEAREFLEDVFQCSVGDWYSCREVDSIAHRCEFGSVHISTDQCVLEVVDNKDMPLPVGKHGRLVVTSLNNTVMPTIRYDFGDRGRIIEKPCQCGLPFPALFFEGREVEFIRLPDERIIHPFRFTGPMDRRFDAILQYQIVRNGPWTFCIRVTPTRMWMENEKRHLLTDFQNILGAKAQITVEMTESLMPPGQKNAPYVSLYKQT